MNARRRLFDLPLWTAILTIAVWQPATMADDLGAAKGSDSAAVEPEEHFGLSPLIARVQQLQSDPSVNVNQRLEATNNLLMRLLQLSAQIRVVTNRIDREVADADQRRAILAERRDRAVRINTYADLISGGITGMIGGGLKLRDVNHIAPDIIDTVEGGVQTGLSTWALQQQRGEQRIERTRPGLLAAIIDPTKRNAHDYPDDVWAFLNAKQSNGQSLREQLATKWARLGFCLRHAGHRTPPRERMIHMAMMQTGSRATIDLLEDRIAMLYDLKATVTNLDDELLEATSTVQAGRQRP